MHISLKSAAVVASALAILGAAPVAAQQRADTAGRFVTVFGAKIYYVERGTGPVVVLVHGLGDQASVWNQSIGPLSAGHRVIALDLVGFGRSDKPLLDYRPDTFVDFLSGFLTELHVTRASFVGNSLGGWVVALYALRHPEAVESLVLVDAAGYKAGRAALSGKIADAFRLSRRDDYRTLSPLTFYDKKFLPDDAALDHAMTERVVRGDAYTITKTMESLYRGDDALDNRLGAIQSPTLIVWGSADGLIPLPLGRRLNHDIKGSRLTVLEKCGHIPEVECSAALNAALLEFLPAATGPSVPAGTPDASSPANHRTPMSGRATGTFEVDVKPLAAYNDASDAQLGRMSLDKRYHGDLEATAKGEMLTAGSYVKGSAGYVAVESVTGTLNGRKGSFALQHSGTLSKGSQSLSISVVPDSGTGELSGITGSLSIVIENGKHSYVFDYTLPAG
jgi:pimeloyl-ACP methyl ester carboxylesterase